MMAQLFAQDQLLLLGDIQSGPTVYYSPEAYSYFTRKGQVIPPQTSKENATRCYLAAIKLKHGKWRHDSRSGSDSEFSQGHTRFRNHECTIFR